METDYEKVSKEDGAVQPCTLDQVKRGLTNAVHDVAIAVQHIDAGQQIANNFWTYRRKQS
jgi:hypothetical protein